jgi:hypothetical protein
MATYYVGLDVHLRHTTMCILDGHGKRCNREPATQPCGSKVSALRPTAHGKRSVKPTQHQAAFRRCRCSGHEHVIVHSLMRPFLVIMFNQLRDESVHVLLAEDDEVVEGFLFCLERRTVGWYLNRKLSVQHSVGVSFGTPSRNVGFRLGLAGRKVR